MARWQQKPKLTTKQQQDAQRTKHLAQCQQGNHHLTPTFRAGERVCQWCGMVLSCPACLSIHHLPPSRAERAYPLACALHTKAEVR